MHIKFLAHSTGSGQKAIEYLLGELDSKGENREEVSVLRGNPEQIGKLIDCLKTVHRYTSGVIAWTASDNPSADEIGHVLDDFERTAFAGLKKNQYTWSAVLHRETDGSVHVHIIVPRVELVTGKSMNVAPPGWEMTFDPLRTYWNRLKGWARPEDPLLQKLVSGPTQKRFAWKKGEDLRQQITSIIENRIADGLIFDRADVLETLAGLGEITRTGADYVSVKIDGEAKSVRLKGALYGDKFTVGSLREAAAALARRPGGREEPDLGLAQVARGELESAISRRIEYNESRYPAPQPRAGRGAQERIGVREEAPGRNLKGEGRDVEVTQLVIDLAIDRQRAPQPVPGGRGDGLELVEGGADRAAGDRAESAVNPVDSAVLQESRRPESLQVKEVAHGHRSESRLFGNAGTVGLGRQTPFPIRPVFGLPGVGAYIPALVQVASLSQIRSLGAVQSFDSVHKLPGSGLDARRQKPKRLLPDHESNQLEHRRAPQFNGLRRARDGEEVANGSATDSARALTDRVIEQAKRAAQRTSDAVVRAVAAVRNSTAGASEAHRRSSVDHQIAINSCRKVDSNIVRVRANMDDELDRFKSQISLVDYAVSTFGYEVIEKESSKGCKVLKCGGDKILVARAEDGHDLYYNVHDDSDSGSLIDLIQKRATGRPNLGQVRKELRSWLPGSKKPAIRRPPTERSVRPVVSTKDRGMVLANWARTKPYSATYLTRERGISADTIKAFGVTEDLQGYACFKHRDITGEVSGYEMKRSKDQDTPTRFAAGGDRGLWWAKPGIDPVSRIVITESALDALSYAQMHHLKGTLYVSTGGSIKAAQEEMLAGMLAKNNTAEVVLAHDRDAGGKAMAEQVKALAQQGQKVLRHEPGTAKDWNGQLQVRQLKERQEAEQMQAQLDAVAERNATLRQEKF